jgi:DNA modification methylase
MKNGELNLMTGDMTELLVVYQKIEHLKNNPGNSRTHSKRQVRQIADSIKAFGFTNPVLLDRNNTVIAGHGRVSAASLLGMSELPTIRLESLSADQVRAYVIADNRLAEKAGWDKSILAIELQHLLEIETELDVTITGFEIPEIDLLLAAPDCKPDPDDEFEIAELSADPVTKHGDVWQLGRHRILCGNSVEERAFSMLLGEKQAQVVFTDPPYNVEIKGNVSGKGLVQHREFEMASGEMSEAEFVSFLTSSLRLLARYSSEGSVHFICMDWRHVRELQHAGRQAYESLLNICVWVKNNAGMGSFYRSQHELVFVFRNGHDQHRNNVQLGRYGRNRTNVWEYPNASTFSKLSDEGNLLAVHPTVKPVALVADALLDCSARGDLVLDAFLGSGSTLIAAERTGRSCYGIELDGVYVDAAIKRWQRYTGDRAVHAVSGIAFDQFSSDKTEVNHA